jgi:hypothetical protein
MWKKFRTCYPQGSLVGELIDIDRGLYIVRVSVQVDGIILATGLAAEGTVELAEDRARERAISTLILDRTILNSTKSVSTLTAKTPADVKKEEHPVVETSQSTPLAAKISEPAVSLVELEPIKEPALPNSDRESVVAEFRSTEVSTAPASSPEDEIETTEETIPLESASSAHSVEDEIDTSNSGNLFADTYNTQATEETIALESAATSLQSPIEDNIPDPTVKIDFYAVKHETDIELQRLGWTSNEGRDFLKRQYGKPSRLRLTDEELLEFLHHLKSLPTPK